MLRNLLILLFFAALLPGCESKKHYAAISGEGGSTYFLAFDGVQKIWDSKTEFTFENFDVCAANSNTNIKMLAAGDVDFCIAQNDAIIQLKKNNANPRKYDNIRTLIPLYPEILFIVYKKEIKANSLRELVSGRTVAMGPKTSGTAAFVKSFFTSFNIDTTIFTPFHSPLWAENTISDSVDVACVLTAFNLNTISKMLNQKGGKLFSLGDPKLANQGSSVDGFCWRYYAAKPFIIPKGTYGSKPEKPVLTVAIDAILQVDEAVESDVVYELVESLVQNKQSAVVDNILLAEISADFNPDKLGFPLHEGTRMYLDKDKPTFIEKWSEPMALGFSILIAFVGGISSFVRWQNFRKKNRIDVYYKKILEIEKNIDSLPSKEEFEKIVETIIEIRNQAFRDLMKEKLLADESFRIYINLQNDVLNKLYRKMELN